MKPIKSTAEILAFKVLNRNIDSTWVDWATEMLVLGFDSVNLAILAGEHEPFNQFEMQELTSKVLSELQLDYSDREQTIKNYTCYLIDKALEGEMENIKVLCILKDICVELNYEKYLYHFYTLYFAKDALLDSDFQGYLEDADKSSIDNIIHEYFTNWKSICDMSSEKATNA